MHNWCLFCWRGATAVCSAWHEPCLRSAVLGRQWWLLSQRWCPCALLGQPRDGGTWNALGRSWSLWPHLGLCFAISSSTFLLKWAVTVTTQVLYLSLWNFHVTKQRKFVQGRLLGWHYHSGCHLKQPTGQVLLSEFCLFCIYTIVSLIPLGVTVANADFIVLIVELGLQVRTCKKNEEWNSE